MLGGWEWGELRVSGSGDSFRRIQTADGCSGVCHGLRDLGERTCSTFIPASVSLVLCWSKPRLRRRTSTTGAERRELASFAARSCVSRTLSPCSSRASACQLLGTFVRRAVLLSSSVIFGSSETGVKGGDEDMFMWYVCVCARVCVPIVKPGSSRGRAFGRGYCVYLALMKA